MPAPPAPLSALKQLPPSPSSSPRSITATHKPSLKRVFSRDGPAVKKQKSNAHPYSSSPAPTTPSSEVHFKIPSIPLHATRAVTPSTSTVACSSSPPRIDSSSPTRAPPALKRKKTSSKVRIAGGEGMEQHIQLVSGKTLIFGRHRHRPLSLPASDGVDSPPRADYTSEPVEVSSTVPTHLRHLLYSLTTPGEIVHLSRHASHASRVHAALEYIEGSDTVRVVVIGQNGLKIDGRRILSGQRVEMPRKDFVLDFYGARVNISFPAMPSVLQLDQSAPATEALATEEVHEAAADLEADADATSRERLFTPTPSSPRSESQGMSLPPSSPPLPPLDMSSDRASSPLSAAEDEEDVALEDDEMEVDGEDEVASQENDVELQNSDTNEKEVKAELIETIAKPASRKSTPQPQVVEEVKPVPADVDLPALLASTVVFSGSSKLSLPDMVKHMLESQPSLRSYGEESVWRTWCDAALEENPMFGKVQRHGKDSSGHPLLPHYFYNPDLDPDTSRSKELGGLVRPLRTVQRGGGKAIDWRPVGSGRRKYW